MLERFRFARYALKFERAFKTDGWDDVKACFGSDADETSAGSRWRAASHPRAPSARP
jgi:hypothetical protein